MGSAQSVRRIQLGGLKVGRPGSGGSPCGTASRSGSSPVGRISSAVVRRDRLWFGLKRPGVEGGSPLRRRVLHPPAANRRFPGPREMTAAVPATLRGSTGPPAPGATVDWAGLSSVRLDRVALPGGVCSRQGARGRRRCRLPIRPVLKHGPRSLTRARVSGLF